MQLSLPSKDLPNSAARAAGTAVVKPSSVLVTISLNRAGRENLLEERQRFGRQAGGGEGRDAVAFLPGERFQVAGNGIQGFIPGGGFQRAILAHQRGSDARCCCHSADQSGPPCRARRC